ncbi:hypothetical protein PR048_026679 [Dryococelus australis]|uniref:Uncharacterized protein n=1 Tax=Dryococelus australis TaxID=614101 RepID=A0ABQ9GM10_9NEOP|nr:hypothetical protein PR048_026679 [Dryococelus australis]
MPISAAHWLSVEGDDWASLPQQAIAEMNARRPADQRHCPARFQICENPVTRTRIEPCSPWWEASVLTAQSRWPPRRLVTSLPCSSPATRESFAVRCNQSDASLIPEPRPANQRMGLHWHSLQERHRRSAHGSELACSVLVELRLSVGISALILSFVDVKPVAKFNTGSYSSLARVRLSEIERKKKGVLGTHSSPGKDTLSLGGKDIEAEMPARYEIVKYWRREPVVPPHTRSAVAVVSSEATRTLTNHPYYYVTRTCLPEARSPIGPRCIGVTLLASHQGEPGSIPGGVNSAFSYLGIVPVDAAGRRLFSGIFRFPRPCILVLLHTHLASTSSDLKTAMTCHEKDRVLHTRFAAPLSPGCYGDSCRSYLTTQHSACDRPNDRGDVTALTERPPLFNRDSGKLRTSVCCLRKAGSDVCRVGSRVCIEGYLERGKGTSLPARQSRKQLRVDQARPVRPFQHAITTACWLAHSSSPYPQPALCPVDQGPHSVLPVLGFVPQPGITIGISGVDWRKEREHAGLRIPPPSSTYHFSGRVEKNRSAAAISPPPLSATQTRQVSFTTQSKSDYEYRGEVVFYFANTRQQNGATGQLRVGTPLANQLLSLETRHLRPDDMFAQMTGAKASSRY